MFLENMSADSGSRGSFIRLPKRISSFVLKVLKFSFMVVHVGIGNQTTG